MENNCKLESCSGAIKKLWELLSTEEQQQLVEGMRIVTFGNAEVIFSEDDEYSHLMYLIEGGVKMLRKGISRQQQIVRLVQPNAFFGCQSVFSDMKSPFTAVAMNESKVAMLPVRLIRSLVMSNPQAAMFFLRELSDMLAVSIDVSITISQKHMRGRMAALILLVLQKFGTEADGKTLRIKLSRAEWANITNMTVSNAIRTISAFASEGILAIKGRNIAVLHEAALHDISQRG